MASTTVEAILGAGLLAYWHADDLTAGDGNAISSWLDRKNSIDMAQATGSKQPTQRDDYASTGYAAAEFDGTDDALSCTDADLDVSKFAILAAVKQNTAAAADTVYAVGGATYCRLMADSTSKGDFRVQNGGVSSIGAQGSTTGVNVVAARCQTEVIQVHNYEDVGLHITPGTLNTSDNHFMGARNGTMQYFDGGIFAIAFVDLNVCSWYGVIEAMVQMQNDFGLTLLDTLPQAAEGGGSSEYSPFRKPIAFGA